MESYQIMFTPTTTTLIPPFFTLFLLIYLFAYLVVFRNWGPPKHVAEASSCLISLAHGTPAVFMAIYAITTSTTTTASSFFSAPNTSAQNSVLDYSMAYFLLDLMHYVVFFPKDALIFIAHHVATLYVLATCHYAVGHGASALLVVLVLAEATSACQNAWALAGSMRDRSPAASRLYKFLCPRFYALYSVFRGVLAPLFMLKMGSVFAAGGADDVIPKWAWVSWMVVITTAILVSILWVSIHWIEWFDRRRSKASKVV